MPIVYQLLKSVGHSTMALAEVVMPYIESPKNQSWRASLLAYRSRMQSALESVNATDMQEDWKANNVSILQNNIAFMDQCAEKGAITLADMQDFAKKQAPLLKLNIAWAAETQVAHWMEVVADWKKQLGSDWDKTYAASNTIYVARQNNVIFSVLAQFFPPDAINDRLMLIETISFTTTPQEMLDCGHPHRRRPAGGRPVLRQPASHGFRADGRQCPQGDHRRDRQARDDAQSAAGRALRIAPVADPDHPGHRPDLARRSSLNQRVCRFSEAASPDAASEPEGRIP